jgi:outer membrane protein assembly factor BamB
LPGHAQISITTQHNDLTRSGWNNKENILTPANVNVRQFGKIFSVAVDDQVYTQPLILSNVMIGDSLRNIAAVGTVKNTVYAFDADKGTLFWSKNYTAPGLRVVYTTDFLGPCDGGENTDVSKNVGIIGTPVIDSTTATLYFVTRCTDAVTPGVGNFLHLFTCGRYNEWQ